MIRFKQAAAASIPVPPAGYVALFADAATGEPSMKDSTGAVVTLKGQDGADGEGATGEGGGLPEGGEVGQVLLRTADGATWGDAPAGEPSDGPPLVNVLPDAMFYFNDIPTDDPHNFELLGFTYPASGSRVGPDLIFPAPAGKEPARIIATVVVTVAGADFESSYYTGDIEGGFPNVDNNASRELIFETDYASGYRPEGAEEPTGLYSLSFGIAMENGEHEPSAAYLGWHVTGLQVAFVDLPVTSAGESQPLPLTPVAFATENNGGGGGGPLLMKADLPGVTTITIEGYFDVAGEGVASDEGYFAPAFPESSYVAMTPFDMPTFMEGDAWGWHGSDTPSEALPERDPLLCRVSLDGAAPVVALIRNPGGV